MKKILLTFLFSTTFAFGAFADYGQAIKQVQTGNYSAALAALQDSLDYDSKSQYLMGFMYYHGLGITQDYKKAVDYFELSANGGNIDSQTFLAYMYDEGKGVKVDKKKAFDLYQASSEAGDITATMNLAVMYYHGGGVPQNYDKAFALMDSIENARNSTVQVYLGNFYFYGFGVKKDMEKAVPYYIRAAQLGSVEAHYMLGHVYQNGLGIPGADSEKAVKYYEYAAMNKHPQAQFNLATMYADGQAGAVDKVSAYMWLSEAVKNKVPEAQGALSMLSETMTLSEISRAKESLIELNKKMTNPTAIESVSLNEDIGDKSFKAEPVTATGFSDFTVSTDSFSQDSGIAAAATPAATGGLRIRSPRMIRRR